MKLRFKLVILKTKVSKPIIMLLISLWIYNQKPKAQVPQICIPKGSAINVDGHFSAGEWDDAESVQIPIAGNKKVTVKYKHDNVNILLSYINNLESSMLFPEVMFDINNDKTNNWKPEDKWFHVSATDCESSGAPNNYNNCKIVQPDWQAVPNFVSGPPNTDTVEISIPFIKLSSSLAVNDTIGIAFDVTNTFSVWNYWPAGANNSNPSTWGTAVICEKSSGYSEELEQRLKIYPNPCHDVINIDWKSETPKELKAQIYRVDGSLVKSLDIVNEEDLSISVKSLERGVYFLRLISASESFSRMFVKE